MMLWSLVSFADQKRCPVCHQVFEDSVEICPNDGTNLGLVGEKITPPQPSDEVSISEPDETVEEIDEPNEAETSEKHRSGHKYTRQDRGGRRKRVVTEEDNVESDERTDRQRRLQDERGTSVPGKKKEPQVDEDAILDAELRSQYRLLRDKAVLEDQNKPEEEPPVDPELERQKALWKQTAPHMSIGGRFSWMGEADNPGPVMGAEIDLNLLRTNIRVGLSSFIGIRHVSRHELIFLESVSIGVQKPWRFSPYMLGRIGIGTIVSQRFGEDITNLVRAIGFDAGVDCRLNNAFVVTPSVGYVRYGVRDAAWDSVTLKVSLGF